ncbi:aKG-HExxH-type peptide beta-hydroxylase [Streptomyces sp. NPDC060035]|uniref:aKG-HExxH-type peptide beta-hydroxylase n=1 Tax=Streptomyces sp. NPDC060035 TaxID=3347044 RepID=UPI003676E0A7
MAAPVRHLIPRETFLALARGRGGASAVAVLRAGQLSKRRLLLSAVRRVAEERAPGVVRQLRLAETYDRIEQVRQESTERWEAVLLHPYLDLWAAAALRALYTETGGNEVDPAPAGLARLLDPGGPVLRVESRGRCLAVRIDDRGPYREAHGDPVPGPLDGATVRRWEELLSDAWQLLVERHPWHAEAVGAGVSTLVPLRPKPDGTAVSSVVRRGYGAVGVSLPADAERLALALVHEFLHIQLGALLDLVPLHGPDSGARYHAPWRTDPRPVGALLQGTYAHLGVSDFWRVERGRDNWPGPLTRSYADGQYGHWRERTADAARTLLESGELNVEGQQFVGELSRTISDWDRDMS